MKPCTDAEMRAEFKRRRIPLHALGERFDNIYELLIDTAPENATELDACIKAAYCVLDQDASIEWEDDDVCELDGEKMEAAAAPREWFAVLDCDGYGEVYSDKREAERGADLELTPNAGNNRRSPQGERSVD